MAARSRRPASCCPARLCLPEYSGAALRPAICVAWCQLPGILTCVSPNITRSHGAPQAEQQPFSEVPAIMHGLTRAGGKVAKCADGKGNVAMSQTLRLF